MSKRRRRRRNHGDRSVVSRKTREAKSRRAASKTLSPKQREAYADAFDTLHGRRDDD